MRFALENNDHEYVKVVAQDAAVALTWAYQTYGFRTAELDYLSTEEVAIAE